MEFTKERATEWVEINLYQTPNDLDKKIDALRKRFTVSTSEIIDDFIVSTCGEILLAQLNTTGNFSSEFSIIKKFSLNRKFSQLNSHVSCMRMARLLKTLYPEADTSLLTDFESVCSTGIVIENVPFCVNIVGLYIHYTTNPTENHCETFSEYDSEYQYYSNELLRSVLVSKHEHDFMHSALVLLQDICDFFNAFRASRYDWINNQQLSMKEGAKADKNYHFTLFKDITSMDDLDNEIEIYNSAIRHLYNIARHESNKSFLRLLKNKLDDFNFGFIDDEDNNIINHLKLIN